ncbi:MAG: hypothetical protein ACFFDW_16260 [Candidatus Thorarchaeota archaeon]
MSSEEKESKAKQLFESRLLSILLMVVLIIMCSLFVIVVWQFFGSVEALTVLMYTGIGLGAGIITTILLLIIIRQAKIKASRNIFLGLVFIILIGSLVISLILNVTIGSWAFIYASSIGLGITTGIAITYLILAMLKSKLLEPAEKIDDLDSKIEEK